MKYLACLLIVMAFCSCSSSGKLSGLKYGYILTKKQIHVTTSPAGLTGLTVTYNGSNTIPTSIGTILNAGSYSPAYIETYAEYELKQRIKDKLFWGNIWNKVLASLWYIIPCVIVILIFYSRKDEVITLPDEYNENY